MKLAYSIGINPDRPAMVLQQPPLNKTFGLGPSGFINRLVLLTGVHHEACV